MLLSPAPCYKDSKKSRPDSSVRLACATSARESTPSNPDKKPIQKKLQEPFQKRRETAESGMYFGFVSTFFANSMKAPLSCFPKIQKNASLKVSPWRTKAPNSTSRMRSASCICRGTALSQLLSRAYMASKDVPNLLKNLIFEQNLCGN